MCCCLCVSAQEECASLTAPLAGATDVPLDATINWSEVDGVNGYILNIGTAPGANDILNNRVLGLVNTYTPDIGLPPQTTIYVTIAPFYFDRPSVTCPPQTFVTAGVSAPPPCTRLSSPVDGAEGVEFTPSLSWPYAYGANGYFINAGTAPGATDLLNNVDVGNFPGFTFTQVLPPDTRIYITIIPYNGFGSPQGCSESSFTTQSIGSPPGCTFITSPRNGDRDTPLTTRIDWEPEEDATGYIVNMGYQPGSNNILDNATFFSPTARVLNFLPNSTVYITITPYNEAGEATGCTTESFYTTAGCGPYIDRLTGEVVDLNPRLSIPDTLAFCGVQKIAPLTGLNPDLSYTWYRQEDNQVIELGNSPTLDFEEAGAYFVEVTDTIQQENTLLECTSVQSFTVVITEPPELTGVDFSETPTGIRIEVSVAGNSNYEYALNNESGPYSPRRVFEVTEQETYTLFVREPLACGISAFELKPVSFPNFFTPNADGYNDVWKPVIIGASQPDLVRTHIFDRYGKLLKTLGPDDPGWNGTYNSRQLPASDYWYHAEFTDGSEKKGHFALKR